MSVLAKTKQLFLSLGAIFTALILSFGILSTPVFADPATSNTTTSENQTTENNTEKKQDDKKDGETESSTNVCYDESGSLGWLVCPTTGFLARIVDGLYDVIQEMLVVKPLTSDSDSAFHQIWSIFRDITNVIFVIFFLVVIYSQITGVGISNYGIKKVLPKIIVSAILINLSYIICAALVDISNIAGSSLRSVFTDIEQNITPTGLLASSGGSELSFNYAGLLAGIISGTLLTTLSVGAAGGIGYIFISLLPVLLGAVVAIAIAFLTIASRQAFVYLLIMISPLAFVCNLLPNTEQWFTKWKKSLSQMLLFYPMFAALFGASSLVGWTIIAAAETPIMLVLGIAVRVIPLFACWSLLKMSGTLPGQINAALTKFSTKPLGAFRSYAAEEAAARRAKYFGAKPREFQLGRRFGQSLQDRNARRISDTQKYLEMAKLRGAAYASDIRDRNGHVTRRGRQLDALQAQSMDYQRRIAKNANDAEKGLYHYAKNSRDEAKLKAIDMANLNAADNLYYETSRGEKIRFDNIQSRQDRINAAFNANSNAQFNATKRAEQLARTVNQQDYARYRHINEVLEGDLMGTHLVGANAASDYDTQVKLLGKKFGSYFSYLPPTQELYDRLFQLTATDHIAKDIDPILAGMTALNMRGDTDLVTDVVERMLETKQIRLGTHASQSLANFCMFTTKDSDIFLRRFGKYINLETARVYNENQSKPKRKNDVLTLNEYITGHYDEYDDNGNLVPNKGDSKLSLSQLVEGTPIDKVERTYFDNMATRVRNAYVGKNAGDHPDPDAVEAFKAKMGEIELAMGPAFISAMLSKYASGSEQIVNGAADLTGLKRDGQGGWKHRWTDPKDSYFGVGLEFFAKRVKNYLKWQTPSQIAGLRTDVFIPITETLGLWYVEQLKEHLAHPNDPNYPDPADSISPELLEVIDKPASEIPSWYGDGDEEIKKTDSEEVKAKKKERNKQRKEFRDKLAKAAFMDILFKNKTLDQLIINRRSGVTAGTKASVRSWLGLDSDDFVEGYRDDVNERKKQRRIERRKRKDEKRKQQQPPEEETPSEPTSESGESGFAPTYSRDERDTIKETITQIYNDNSDSEEFYDECIDELESYGLNNIVDQVEDHHERDPDEPNDALLDFILGLIDDDGNF